MRSAQYLSLRCQKCSVCVQATSALMCRAEGEAESGGVARPLHGATREARYIDLMRTMQFGECLI